MQNIGPFEGEYAFLSNFYPAEIDHPNLPIVAPTLEHAYQALKTVDYNWQMKILEAKTPGKAKVLGKKAPIVPNWDDIKIGIMLDLVHLKFQDEELAEKLIATNPAILRELNNWADTFWGVDTVLGFGANWLGRILMIVRSLVMNV